MTEQVIDFGALRDRYLQHQLRGDRRAALQFIDSVLQDGSSVDDIKHRIVQSAQEQIGRLWQEDRITIAQEHMATAISQLVLSHLFSESEFRERLNRKIVVACVPGEHHEFPGRLLADALDVAGYDVRFLGADVPEDALMSVLKAESPDVVALSVTMLFHVPVARATVRAIRAAALRGLAIAVGGAIFHERPDLVKEVGADLVATDAESFIAGLVAHFETLHD